MNEPTHLDLCSGVGGFTLAAEWAGFRTIGFSEINPHCCRVLKRHWPCIRNFGDARTIPDGQCDIITSGFPCQPFSNAGRKLGEADNRNIWPTMLDVVRRWRPTWFVGENVTHIANMVLAKCLDELEGIGYRAVPFDISACAVGLPTMERHVWIIASRDGYELERNSSPIVQGPARLAIGHQDSAGDAGQPRIPDLPASRLLRSRKGFPAYVDRISAIGNAIPWQVAAVILKEIRKLI